MQQLTLKLTTTLQWLPWYTACPGKKRLPVHGYSSFLVSLCVLCIDRMEESLLNSFQLFPFQNGNLTQCPVSFPYVVLGQPCLETDTSFSKWQAEQWVCDVQGERIAFGLLLEDCSPLLVTKTRQVVMESPSKIMDSGLPSWRDLP